jgi:uncharacterized protein YecT (DUF1311 family)
MKKTIIILSLIFSINLAYSQSYEESRNYYENSDNKLNDIYKQLIDLNRTDSVFVTNLRTSERAWIQYRDAQLNLLYPDDTNIEEIKTMSQNELIYLAHLTENRTKILLEMLKPFTTKEVYVSDLEVIRSKDIHGGLGIDKPYWTSEILICGKIYKKGIVVHPEAGGPVAYVEFQIPKEGGHLLGVVGWAGGTGSYKYRGRMRYRILIDGELIYGDELVGKECKGINLDLSTGKVLRIETDDGGDGNYSDHLAFGNLRIEY